MKAFVVCAALLASAVQATEPAANLRSWGAFKAKHSKAYTPAEESSRMAKFASNDRFIEKHNARFAAGLESFELGHNEMSDLSLEEIMSTRMGFVLPPNAREIHCNASVHAPSSSVSAPSEVDWRNQKCVQRVKNQGSCGSCYTFSAICALETAYCIKQNKYLADLSEQQLVDCGGRGCSGGWMHDMFAYLKKAGGSSFQTEYPYTGTPGYCNNNIRRVVQVDSHKMIPVGNEKALLDAVSTVGTISIAYNAGTTEHAYYRGGILDIPNCGNTPTHAVSLIGYGTENGKDFWILKNSWGESWGEKGFFRLRRGQNQCGIADWASYPVV